jgi:transcription antitermination factor NusG
LPVSEARWFALWTHSHCEQLVCDQLTAKGFDAFLPTIRDWSRRAGVRRLISRPMFPSYLFVRHSMDKHSYIEITKSNGLVRILGERWDKLAPIPDTEIEAIRQLVTSELSLMPYPYLRAGQRVRIVEGPLSGMEGILVRCRPNRSLLVLSVELLHRSVAVEVDCGAVVPVELSPRPIRQVSHELAISATAAL